MANPTTTAGQHATDDQPVPAGFHHVSVPVKDIDQARRFYTQVLGGEVVLDTPAFKEVRCGGMIIGLSQKDGGWTAPDAEFPHYAFLMNADDFVPFKQRLEQHGVPTHPIWTRNGYTALMYFRDPSGNLFELYCPRFNEPDKLVQRDRDGFTPPIGSLSYEWQG